MDPSSPPLPALLGQALADLGLDLPPDARERLVHLTALVEQWGSRINLTGHQGQAAILSGLVVEALALERVLPPATSLLDLGSGAGFPGLPVAVARPSCAVTLLDARERRHHFQRAAIRTLGLENVTPLLGRAERLEPRAHEVVVAQALAQPAGALELMQRWGAPGGWLGLAVSEAPDWTPELRARFGEPQIRCYRVPLTERSRTLVLVQLDS